MINWTLTAAAAAKLVALTPATTADANWIAYLRRADVMSDADAQALVDDYDFSWDQDFIQA